MLISRGGERRRGVAMSFVYHFRPQFYRSVSKPFKNLGQKGRERERVVANREMQGRNPANRQGTTAILTGFYQIQSENFVSTFSLQMTPLIFFFLFKKILFMYLRERGRESTSEGEEVR